MRVPGSWRAMRAAAATSLLVMLPFSGTVQAQGLPSAMPVVTLDQDAIYERSLYGQTVQNAFEAEAAALAAENRRIEAEMEAAERDLTARRATLPTEEFRALAEAFDARAEAARDGQGTKERALERRRQELRQTFFARALPVLGDLMAERGAVAIIDKGAIVLAFGRIDMTEDAILRLDEVLGNGSGPRRQEGDSAPAAPETGIALPGQPGTDLTAPMDGAAPPP